MSNIKETYQIGLYLEKALKDKKMSIKELSKISGINQNLLRSYLINERKTSIDAIKKIADALNMDIEYFTNDSYFKNGDIKATILNNDLILHINETDEKDLRKAYKTMSRMMNQIFNSVSLEGKNKIIHSLYIFLITYIREVAYVEENPDKDPWKHLYSDSSLLHDMFGINEKDYAKLRIAFDKLLNNNVDEEEKEEFLNDTLDKVNTTNQLEEQKKDDN